MSLEYRLSTAAPRAKVTWTSTRCTSGAHSPRSSPRCSRCACPHAPVPRRPPSVDRRSSCMRRSVRVVTLVCASCVHECARVDTAHTCRAMFTYARVRAFVPLDPCAPSHAGVRTVAQYSPHGRARARCSHVGKRQHCSTLAQRIAPEVSRQSAARDRRVPRDAAPSAN